MILLSLFLFGMDRQVPQYLYRVPSLIRTMDYFSTLNKNYIMSDTIYMF